MLPAAAASFLFSVLLLPFPLLYLHCSETSQLARSLLPSVLLYVPSRQIADGSTAAEEDIHGDDSLLEACVERLLFTHLAMKGRRPAGRRYSDMVVLLTMLLLDSSSTAAFRI